MVMDVEGRGWDYGQWKKPWEKRRHRRAVLPGGQVLCACRDRTGLFELRDISSSGVCLGGCNIAEEGAHVELEVLFAHSRVARASATVCHRERDGSLGLHFDHILDADRALIRGVVVGLLKKGFAAV